MSRRTLSRVRPVRCAISAIVTRSSGSRGTTRASGTALATFPPANGYVFHSPEGDPLRRTNFRCRAFLPAVRASVGEPLRFHDLRHTHVAMLIAQGEHPKVIQTRVGHSSIQVTLDLYGHLFEGLDEAVAARLDEGFAANGATRLKTKRKHEVVELSSRTRENPR